MSSLFLGLTSSCIKKENNQTFSSSQSPSIPLLSPLEEAKLKIQNLEKKLASIKKDYENTKLDYFNFLSKNNLTLDKKNFLEDSDFLLMLVMEMESVEIEILEQKILILDLTLDLKKINNWDEESIKEFKNLVTSGEIKTSSLIDRIKKIQKNPMTKNAFLNQLEQCYDKLEKFTDYLIITKDIKI